MRLRFGQLLLPALLATSSLFVSCRKEEPPPPPIPNNPSANPTPAPSATAAAPLPTPAATATPAPPSPTPAPTTETLSLDGGVEMELSGARTGDKVAGSKEASIRYVIRQEDGTEIDRTAAGAPPLKVMLEWGTGIPGLDDALARMAEGDKATVKIPAARAWHPEVRPPQVPADANVILEIEVLAVD